MKGMMGTGRIARGSLVAPASLFALVLAFGPTFAATIVVPNDFLSIQDAVDAASAGDTILIKKGDGPGPNGEYQEEDLIIDVKDLTLKCAGAVLDGAIPSDAPGGPVDGINSDGIHIDADGVTVMGCTVQNFDGDGIDVDGDGATIINNTIVNNGVNGLNLDGDDFLVKNNTAIHNANYTKCEEEEGGFVFGSSDGTVVGNLSVANSNDGFRLECCDSKRVKFLRNRAFRNQGDGFDIIGEDLTLVGNRAEVNEDDGFNLGGPLDKSFVANNLARGNDGDGFEMDDADDNTFIRNAAIENGRKGFESDDFDNDGNKFERNIAIGNNNEGFDSSGDRNEFVNNRAIENQGVGFELDCIDDGLAPTGECTGPIIGNRAIRSANEEGFDLETFVKTTISGNKAIGNNEEGFEIRNVDKTLFENNLARDSGQEGFRIGSDSNSNTLKNNRSIGNAEDGFQISDSSSDSNTIIKNTIRNNFGDGIDIDGDSMGNVIDGNTVRNNRGTGIESDAGPGADTVIKNNTMKGNRTDLAGRGDEGNCSVCPPGCTTTASTDGGGNTFDTGEFDVCTPGTGDEGPP